MPELIILDYPELASQKINDSTFVFVVKPSKPEYLFLVIDNEHKPMWKARIWITPETKSRELFVNYSDRTITLKDEKEWDKVTAEFVALIESGKGDEADNVAIAFVNKNPGSFLSLWFLSHGLYREKKIQAFEAFKTLSTTLAIYAEYNQMKKLFVPRKYTKIGDPLNEFTLYNKDDTLFNSASISDKWILLHFWSNNCAPCVKEMDSLVSFYNSIDTSKIAFISVALDYQKAKWKNSKTTNKIKWTSLWEADNFYSDLCLNYNVDVLPYFIIFDKEKKIYLITFGDELELIKSTFRSVK